jgi:Lipase (class 3)
VSPDRKLALATLAGAAYAVAPVGLVVDAGDDIRAVLTELDGDLVVAIRGTEITSVENWLTDFDAIPEWHPGLGWIPRGFLRAMLRLLPLVAPHIVGRNVVTTGHSLGGSVSILLAAKLTVTGAPPVCYSANEPAHTGGRTLAKVLAPVDGYISWFGNDPVPALPPIYGHPCAVNAIGHDMLDPFSCHSIDGVVAWLQAQQMAVVA